jgi:uncharacterized protein (DUF2235 family)
VPGCEVAVTAPAGGPEFPGDDAFGLQVRGGNGPVQRRPKNIVLCCDGTANQFSPDRTNVVKLHYTLQLDGPEQIAFYHPGVGTMEAPGALTPAARVVTRVLGLALGYGLSNDIRDAYTFLMNSYQDGDRVYLFGFSRGAYTARSVCSLLAMYGLIRPGNDSLVPYALRMMMAINKGRQKVQQSVDRKEEYRQAVDKYFKLAQDFRTMMSRAECHPHFVGVWDTVSSVGWVSNPVILPFTADNPAIEIGRHAISIDERRAFFRTNRWMPSEELEDHGPKDVKQVWFPGVHSDVGGGYPEAESGLAKIPLQWMLHEARTAGLLLHDNRVAEVLGKSPGSSYVAPDPDGLMHESLKGAWRIVEWIPKGHYDYTTHRTTLRANLGRRRTLPAGALIHESVFQRQKGAYAKRIKLPSQHTVVTTPDL